MEEFVYGIEHWEWFLDSRLNEAVNLYCCLAFAYSYWRMGNRRELACQCKQFGKRDEIEG
jgi:hypothetical protein